MTKIDKLDQRHPYKIHYKRAIRKAGRERVVTAFSLGNHTYSVTLLANILVTSSLLFMSQLTPATPIVMSMASSAELPPLSDLISGKGGPEAGFIEEEENKIELSLKDDALIYSLAGVSKNIFPVVTFTKTFNHLKIANTVMPTTASETSSSYGWRTPPCDGCSADHRGVDFVPGFGKPVFAVADGMVIDMGSNGGYGNYVRLKHLMSNSEGVIEEWETLYAHMKDDSFPEGMMIGSVVKSGDKIGAVGNTGVSTGPHLHFELLINGENVDPLPLLGTYQVVVVTEDEHKDWMFLGETFRTVEKIITYE